MTRKRLVILSCMTAAALVIVSIAYTAYRQVRTADQALSREKLKQQTQRKIAVSIRSFSLSTNTQVRFLFGPPEYRDIIRFGQHIYAATSQGLIVYDENGNLIHHWTTAYGLPSNDLTSLAADKNHLLIGTADAGILLYHDGSWQQLIPGNPQYASVTSMLVTHQGKFFVGTKAGVLLCANGNMEPFYPKQIEGEITRIASARDQILIGTFSSGLYVYSGGKIKHFHRKNGLADAFVTDLLPLAEGCLVSTPSGIQRLKDGRFSTLAANVFAKSLAFEADRLWASTQERGLVSFNVRNVRQRANRRLSAINIPNEKQSVRTLRMLDGRLLALTSGKIEYLTRNGRWKLWLQEERALSDSNISALLRNQETNHLWIGYFDHGIDVVNSELSSKKHLQSDTFFCINHLAADQTGKVYVATANGLATVDREGRTEVFKELDGLLSDRVMQAIPLDPQGSKVAIATARGLTLKENNRFKSIFAFHGLTNNHVLAIAPANARQLYLGTLGGVSSVYNMQIAANWTHNDTELRHNWVNALAIVGTNLFVGTYGGGIQMRTPAGDWMDFPALPDDLEININALYFDGKLLFAGTVDRGFYIYDVANQQWRHFNGPLPSVNVTAFASDGTYLYVGTTSGILQISYDALSTYSIS